MPRSTHLDDSYDSYDRPAGGIPINWPVRSALLVLAAGLVTVFSVAWWLNPYTEDGAARSMATHRQLGLPPCTFVDVTGVPCPSCGMTTSFALLVRGDVPNSLRANWVGTLLASFLLLVVPWLVVSVVRGRAFYLWSFERPLVVAIMTLLALMFLRWAAVLAGMWWRGELRP